MRSLKLPRTLASTVKRPRCAMPITASSMPRSAAPMNQLIENRDDRFAAFDRKSFLSEIFRMQELLELLGRDQLLKQLFFDFGRNRFGVAFDAVAYPLLLLFALNVAALGPDLAAVVSDQHPPDFAESRFFLAAEAVGEELAIQVPDREAVSFGFEFGVFVNRDHVERVDVGDQMAAHAVGVDEFEDARLFLDLLRSRSTPDRKGFTSTDQRSGL